MLINNKIYKIFKKKKLNNYNFNNLKLDKKVNPIYYKSLNKMIFKLAKQTY